MPDLTTSDAWVVLGAAIGLSCIALTLWLLRDEMRCTRPEPWVAVCPCGWESPPQPSERDARTAYDQHVIAELERIS